MQTKAITIVFDGFLELESFVITARELYDEVAVVTDDQVQAMEDDGSSSWRYFDRARAIRHILQGLGTVIKEIQQHIDEMPKR